MELSDLANGLIRTFTAMTTPLDPASALNTYPSGCCDENLDDNRVDKPAAEPRRLKKCNVLLCAIVVVSVLGIFIKGPAILGLAVAFCGDKTMTSIPKTAV